MHETASGLSWDGGLDVAPGSIADRGVIFEEKRMTAPHHILQH